MPVKIKRLQAIIYPFRRLLRLLGCAALLIALLPQDSACSLQLSDPALLLPETSRLPTLGLTLPGGENCDQLQAHWDWLSKSALTFSSDYQSSYSLADLEKSSHLTGNLAFSPGEHWKFNLQLQQGLTCLNYLPAIGAPTNSATEDKAGLFLAGGKSDSQLIAGWEWQASKKFSLNSDYRFFSNPTGSGLSSNFSGRFSLSPRAGMKFDLHREQGGGQEKQLQEIFLESDWGSSALPLKFSARAGRLSQAPGEGCRQEVNLSGGLQPAGIKISYSGSLKQQQGYWEGQSAGRTIAGNISLQSPKLKLNLAEESFTPENTAPALAKYRYSASYGLTPATEFYGLQNYDSSAALTGRRSLGVKHTSGAIRLEASEEMQQSPSGDRNWRDLKLVWRNKTAPPCWAKTLSRQTLGEGARYGFSYWGKSEPGLTLRYRQGTGLGEARANLRLVYQAIVGNCQLGLGHEQNPCLASELLILQAGKRDFLEAGIPLNDRLNGRIWLAQQTLDGHRGRGWACSLGSVGSKNSSWESIFSTASVSGGVGNSYGLRYSRQEEGKYLKLQFVCNPALQTGRPAAWRMDIALSQPI
jgi:hypothetical protein